MDPKMLEQQADSAQGSDDGLEDILDLFPDEDSDNGEGAQDDAPGEGDGADGEQPPAQPQQQQPRFKVKYMDKELELTEQELITAAQKGIDYDRVRGQLDHLRSAREFAVIDRFARANGMTREQYLDALERTEQERQIQQQVAQGVPQEVAQRLMQLERESQERRQRELAQREEYQRRQQYADLAREYPDIKELPPEVIQAVAAGETPLNAYRAWENQQLKNQLKMAQQQQQVRQKSPGSAAGDLPQDEPDDFLAGFNSI